MKHFVLLFAVLAYTQLYSQFAEGEILDTLQNAVSQQVADLDADGDQDLVILQYNQLVWFENLGGGTLSEQQIIITEFEGWHNLQILDIDGDGLADLVMNYAKIGDPDGKISWFENNGDGTYTEHIILSEKEDYIFATDFDEDGDIDILYTLATDVEWRANDGTGSFGAAEVLIDGSNYLRLFHLFDIDNDGDQDMYHYETGVNASYMNENLGDGTFADSELLFDFIGILQVNSEDFDNDGDEDLMCVYDYNIKYIENIDGVLAVPVAITYAGSSNFFSLGDLNADGLIDLIHETGPAYLKWRPNLGDGIFGDPIAFVNPEPDCLCESGELDGVTYKVAADLDEDGYLEVYADIGFDYSYLMRYANLIENNFEVSGNIYIDENENGIRDIDENGAGFAHVGSTPEEEFGFTEPDGDYTVRFTYDHDAAYDIAPDLPEFWEISSDPTFYSIIIDSTLTYDTLDFGIHPTELVDSIENVLIGANPKCDRIVNYWVSVKNLGSTKPSGLIHLELDDSLTYFSAAIAPDSINEQHLYWHYDDLAYFSESIFSVQVEMPNFLSDGDTIKSILSSTIDPIDGVDFNYHDTLCQVVTCAYDPNDKVASPMGVDEPGFVALNTAQIEYTVRFQNTGSDTATNVHIIDQLDSNIDWTSIVPLASSHPMSLMHDLDGEVTFIFDNIMLPDSNVNELASHGFVKYRVQLNEELLPGTLIENTAEIYFDSNPAVLTNTTKNTLFDCESVLPFIEFEDIICYGDSLHGNVADGIWPSNTIFTWERDGETFEGESYDVLLTEAGLEDVMVTVATDFCTASETFAVLVPELIEAELPNVFICEGDSTVLFGAYRKETGVYYDSLMSIEGCDSIQSVNLMVNPSYLAEESITICEGDSALVFGTYQSVSGEYSDPYTTVEGCDSIEVIHLLVNPSYLDAEVMSICVGDSTLIFGTYQSTAGVYTDTYTTVEGCDSIQTITLTINENPDVEFEMVEDDLICIDAASVLLNGTPFGGEFSGIGVDGSSFDPSLSGEGTFTLVYTYEDDNTCMATDEILVSVIDCLTLPENNAFGLTVFPNPFDDYTKIQYTNDPLGTRSIIIYDILGQEVYKINNISGNSLIIQKSDLGVGVFILSIFDTNGNLLSNLKLVVE